MAAESGSPASAHGRSSTVGRVIAGLGAVVVLGYTGLVPSIVLFASIGSWECLGANCDAAQTALVAGSAAGYLGGLSAVVLLTLYAFRPRRWTLIVALIAILVSALALVLQVWGASTVSSGRDAGAEAMQVAFDVDQVMQQAVADTTGMSVWSTSGVTGPDVRVSVCPDDPTAFQAISSLTFDVEANLPAEDRDAITQAVEVSTTALMLLPDASLTTEWSQDGSRWVLTVTSSCQPIPEGE